MQNLNLKILELSNLYKNGILMFLHLHRILPPLGQILLIMELILLLQTSQVNVEVIKPLDDLLHNSAYMGLETTDKVNTGLGFGAERNHWFIGENMNYYEKWKSSDSVETCPIITTRLLESKGLIYNHLNVNHLNGVTVYPTEYFCAKNSHTGEVCITKKTYTIHHFDASWQTKSERTKTLNRWHDYKIERQRKIPKRIIRKLLGNDKTELLKRIFRIK